MDAKLTLRFLATFIGLALSALGQIDGAKFAADIRAKYGSPLARQTFRIPAGEMVVDYAMNGNVCRVQLPSVGPDDRQPGVKSTMAVDNFILELVPLTLRGKELRRMSMSTGLHSVSTIEYENLVIAEGLEGRERTGITVTFTTEKCQDQPAQ
ncbi:MAG: hypothetical protein JWO80_3849 [Bryobacterales bacterium]|nr:hypothetical protein [Bryobacterales bacterium]